MNKILLRGLFSACIGSMFAMNIAAQTHARKIKVTDQTTASAPMVAKLKTDRMNATVLNSKELGKGVKLQVCKDAKGRMFKRIVGIPAINKQMNVARRAEASDNGSSFAESFEGFNGESTWLPEGWTRKSTEGLDYINSWFIAAPNSWTPSPADGDYFAEIIYATTEQDEWLITPEVSVPENGILSFYSYFEPVYLFDTSNEYIDWDNMTFIEKRVSATLQILVSVDGGEWTLLKDVIDDYKDMSLMDLFYAEPMGMTKMTLSLGKYNGKKIKVAFRYVGKDGDSMFIDNVKVGLPELEASYANPVGTMFWGFDKEFSLMPYSIMMEPVYTPLTWTNTTNNDAAAYSWYYHDPEANEQLTFAGNDLTMTYKPDYTNEFTTRNNLYYLPTLTASAAGASDGTYKAPYDFFQAGGRPDFLFDGEETVSTFGLATCDFLNEGMTIMTVEADDPMEASIPIFGHNEKTTAWWTDHFFQGDQEEGDKAEVDGIINVFMAPASPMAIQGLWLNAKGQISENTEFTAAIYPLSDEGSPTEEPIAMAKCQGKDVLIQEGGMQNYLTLPFRFESPVVVSDKDFSFYIVKVSGFNSDEVTYFAPLQSALPNPDYMCYGWLDLSITWAGKKSNSLIPIANFESEFGECLNSFYINLDATYPWLQGEGDKFEAKAEGESKEFALDSYYDASELKFEANTADGNLPSWLTAKCEGRYGDTKLTFTVAPGTEACSCDVTVSAPGVSKTYQISRNATSGIENVETSATSNNVVGIYNISGQRISDTNNSGSIRIVKYADGSTKKIAK